MQGLSEPDEMAVRRRIVNKSGTAKDYLTPLPLDLQEAKVFFVTSPAVGTNKHTDAKTRFVPAPGLSPGPQLNSKKRTAHDV